MRERSGGMESFVLKFPHMWETGRRGLPSLQLTNSGRETAFIPSYKTLNRHCRHFLLPQLDLRRQLSPPKLVILIIPIQIISPPPLCTSPPRSASRLPSRSRGIPSSLGRNGPTPPRESQSAAGAWNINSISRISIKKSNIDYKTAHCRHLHAS